MSSSSARPANGFSLPFASVQQTARASAVEEDVLSLFDQYQARLLRYALSFSLSLEDGQDVIQETFLSLFQHLRQDRARDNLVGWLFRVTHNLALKRRVKYRNEVSLFDPSQECELEIQDPDLTPEEQILARERHIHLHACLRALPEVDRRCIQLRAEGLRYREIATVLGISLGSVSASLARAFGRLERIDSSNNRK